MQLTTVCVCVYMCGYMREREREEDLEFGGFRVGDVDGSRLCDVLPQFVCDVLSGTLKQRDREEEK